MKRDLEQLLRETDAETDAPTRISNLGHRVRGSLSRKRRIRRGLAACGFAIGVASIAIIAFTSKSSAPNVAITDPLVNLPQDVVTTTTHPTQVNERSAPVHVLVEVHERTAELLMNARRGSSPKPRRSANVDMVHQQRDRAALILIYDADRYMRSDRPADGIAAYRRTVDLFPQSHWAGVARERLKQHES